MRTSRRGRGKDQGSFALIKETAVYFVCLCCRVQGLCAVYGLCMHLLLLALTIAVSVTLNLMTTL